MVWDNRRPDGNKKLNLCDDDLRDNALAIETALDLEHDFATGGGQTGRHRFPIGNDSARDTAYPSPGSSEIGAIWLNTKDDVAPRDWLVAEIWDGTVWKEIGPDAAEVARTDEAKAWNEGQVGAWVDFTESGSGPYAWDWVVNDGTFFKKTLNAGAAHTIANPTGSLYVTANAANYTFEITQAAGTAGTLAFGGDFKPSFGLQPAVDPTPGSRTLIHVSQIAGGGTPELIYRVEYTS